MILDSHLILTFFFLIIIKSCFLNNYVSLQLILELGPYIDELSKTGGAIKEFINPK